MSNIPVKDVTPPSAKQSQSMYEKRQKIYVREIEGLFQKIRSYSLWALMLGYFGHRLVNLGRSSGGVF